MTVGCRNDGPGLDSIVRSGYTDAPFPLPEGPDGVFRRPRMEKSTNKNGYRYREVVQRCEGLWLHHSG